MDAEMENKIFQAIEGLNQKVDSLFSQSETSVNKGDSLSDKLDSLSSQIQEQTQIVKRLLLLTEEMISIEEISSKVNKRPQTKKDKINTKNHELLSFICQQAREHKYDPDSDPVLQAFKKRIRLR